MSAQFLDLLYGEAPREAFDAVVTDAIAAGVVGPELEQLRTHRTIALRIREQIERRGSARPRCRRSTRPPTT